MINYVEYMLRELFKNRIDEINDDEQVRFQPPNNDWRIFVSNLDNKNALNVYLVDLRENRTLRTTERERQITGGYSTSTPLPRRVDCHYLISAWSPAPETVGMEATLAEHALLYKAIDALVKSEPIVPRAVYAPLPLPLPFPVEIADTELPTQVLPPEGFPKIDQFWTTMGDQARWKPCIYFIVTLPALLNPEPPLAMVTTRITEYRLEGHASTAEIWIEIAGHVLTGAPPVSVAGAWVRIEDAAGNPVAVTNSDSDGAFQFGGLVSGDYTLRARATGFVQQTRAITVPSSTGNYDVTLI